MTVGVTLMGKETTLGYKIESSRCGFVIERSQVRLPVTSTRIFPIVHKCPSIFKVIIFTLVIAGMDTPKYGETLGDT